MMDPEREVLGSTPGSESHRTSNRQQRQQGARIPESADLVRQLQRPRQESSTGVAGVRMAENSTHWKPVEHSPRFAVVEEVLGGGRLFTEEGW